MPTNDSLTYDQLKAVMEIQSKHTEQMVLVADRLKDIVEAEKALVVKAEASEDNKKTLVEVKATMLDIANKANFLLIIYTALTGLVAIAFLIVQIVNWSASKESKAELEAQNKYLKTIQQEGLSRGNLQEEIKAIVEQVHADYLKRKGTQ